MQARLLLGPKTDGRFAFAQRSSNPCWKCLSLQPSFCALCLRSRLALASGGPSNGPGLIHRPESPLRGEAADGALCFSQNWMGYIWSRPNWSAGEAAAIMKSWTLEQGTEPPTAPRAPLCWLHTAPGVCALGWVKCREHSSLLVILCIIVYVTNKAHLSLIKKRKTWSTTIECSAEAACPAAE